MRKLSSSLLALSLSAATLPAFATDIGNDLDLSFNVGATTNYIWRGITQSADGPALQGGIDLKHKSGFYIGTWISNTEFFMHTMPMLNGMCMRVMGLL